jgi:hypothetical protein
MCRKTAQLALCKFVRLIKQMTEVTYKPTLELGTSLLSSERALSCHLVFLWQSMARFSFFLGGFFINLLARKGRDTQGYGVKILKMNENTDLSVELSRG